MEEKYERARSVGHARCWYCGVQMWHLSPAELIGVPTRAASRLQCTAEHLVARRDGGKDEAANVVTACVHCKHTIHKRKNPPSPDSYLADVRKQLERGRWHQNWVHEYGLLDFS